LARARRLAATRLDRHGRMSDVCLASSTGRWRPFVPTNAAAVLLPVDSTTANRVAADRRPASRWRAAGSCKLSKRAAVPWSVMANVMPGAWMLAKSHFPSGV
jgi:hypothetical protein